MTNQRSSEVKCEGRFHELREYLFNQVLPLVLEGRNIINSSDLETVWSLVEEDLYRFDTRDPYFNDPKFYNFNPKLMDSLRMVPLAQALSLVPLIADTLDLDGDLIGKYTICRGNGLTVTKNLEQVVGGGNFLSDFLAKIKTSLYFPLIKDNHMENIPFNEYMVGGTFGIGTIISGGEGGGGIRADAPFLLGIYDLGKGNRGVNLAGVIGFWAQNDRMLVAQMQSCKNARYPEGIHFGVGSLAIAEQIAKKIGFKGLDIYSAKHHPVFNEHPGDKDRLMEDFVCIFDSSAKKMGYDGSRGTFYSKNFNNFY